MADISYTWVIEAMDCVPQEDGQTDEIKAALGV
jgi:hypothetical protein